MVQVGSGAALYAKKILAQVVCVCVSVRVRDYRCRCEWLLRLPVGKLVCIFTARVGIFVEGQVSLILEQSHSWQ